LKSTGKIRLIDFLRAVTVFLVISSGGMLLIGPHIEAGATSPRGIYCSATQHDFGRLYGNTPVCARFELRNLLFHSQTIDAVSTTCGCTSVKLGVKTPYTLRPFESITVQVTLDHTGINRYASQNALIFFNNRKSCTILGVSGEFHDHT
jgi:hypothetical protein